MWCTVFRVNAGALSRCSLLEIPVRDEIDGGGVGGEEAGEGNGGHSAKSMKSPAFLCAYAEVNRKGFLTT